MSASTRNTIAWILQVLLGLAFIFSGGGKVAHLSETVSMFGQLGLPGWFAYLVAGGELLGGVGLLVPRLVRPAALGLAVIMAGAAFMHATKIPGGFLPAGGKPNGIPSLVLLVLLLVLVWLRRPTTTTVA